MNSLFKNEGNTRIKTNMSSHIRLSSNSQTYYYTNSYHVDKYVLDKRLKKRNGLKRSKSQAFLIDTSEGDYQPDNDENDLSLETFLVELYN
jgi:hypothetical protein